MNDSLKAPLQKGLILECVVWSCFSCLSTLVLTIKEVMGMYATKHLSVPVLLAVAFSCCFFRWLSVLLPYSSQTSRFLNIEIPG